MRYLIPLDSGLLRFGYDIFVLYADLFQRVGRAAGDQNIFKGGDAAAVRSRIFIYRQPAQRCAVQMKGLILDKTILRRLGNGEIAAFERVGKRDGCCLTGYHSYPFGGLRLIAIFGQLSDFINARADV